MKRTGKKKMIIAGGCIIAAAVYTVFLLFTSSNKDEVSSVVDTYTEGSAVPEISTSAPTDPNGNLPVSTASSASAESSTMMTSGADASDVQNDISPDQSAAGTIGTNDQSVSSTDMGAPSAAAAPINIEPVPETTAVPEPEPVKTPASVTTPETTSLPAVSKQSICMSSDEVYGAYITWLNKQPVGSTAGNSGASQYDDDYDGCWVFATNDGAFSIGED